MKRLLLSTAILLVGLGAGVARADTEIKLARFFGVCDTKSTDIKTAVGEACIIESIIRSFSAAPNGVTVTELPADWDAYYDQLKTAMVGGNSPDVFVIHRSRLPEFAAVGALAEITAEDYAKAGIDTKDLTERAVQAVTYKDKQYGVPLDFHAYLWHVNMELMKQAGLVNTDGSPKLPTSPEELVEQAKLVKEKTGKNYLVGFFTQAAPNMRMFVADMAQQDTALYDDDGANIDGDGGRNALKIYKDLAAAGALDLTVPNEAVRNVFFKGDAAVLIDGTWRVDANQAAIGKEGVALKDYYVSEPATIFETPAAWADTHMWAIPAAVKKDSPEKFAAAMQLLAYMIDHNVDWARTGHLPVRKSVLASPEFNALPHRSEYAGTADMAYYVAPTKKYGAIQDAVGKNLVEYYQTGKSIDDTLADMQAEVEDNLE